MQPLPPMAASFPNEASAFWAYCTRLDASHFPHPSKADMKALVALVTSVALSSVERP